MKKITLLISVSLLAFFSMQAQTRPTSVQGVARDFSQVSTQTSRISAGYTPVNFNAIKYWVGNDTCSNKAALVIKFNDGKGGVNALVWGYRWAAGTEATGEQMIRAIAAEDPDFYLFTQRTNLGSTVCGLGFNRGVDIMNKLKFNLSSAMNDTTHINFRYYSWQNPPKLSLGQTSYPEDNSNDLAESAINDAKTTGILQHPFDQPTYGYAAYDYDWWQLLDTTITGSWRSGWYDGYWSYWITNNPDSDYTYSGVGMTLRTLTNECVDGWSYTSDMVHWYSADMSGDITYIEKPELRTSIVSKSKNIQKEEELEDNLIDITTKEESGEGSITEALKKLDSNKNNIITVDPELAGDTILLTKNLIFADTKGNFQFNGNGVVIKGSSTKQLIYFYGEKTEYKNTHFIGSTMANAAEQTFTNCTFSGEKENGTYPSLAINNQNISCRLINCRFSDIILNSPISAIINSPLSGTSLTLISCTFMNNTVFYSIQAAVKNSGTDIYNRSGKMQLINCVFDEDNKNTPDGSFKCPHSIVSSDNSTFEYNVIEGTVYNYTKQEDITSSLSETNTQGEELGEIVIWSDIEKEYIVANESKAIGHFPANTTIEGITMPENDILGTVIDYAEAVQSGACQTIESKEPVAMDENTLTGKVFIHGRALSVQGYKGYSFSLYDTCGQALQTYDIDEDQKSFNVNVQNGIYLLKGANGKESVSLKVIIK